MDPNSNGIEDRRSMSFGRTSSIGSSVRRRSFSQSGRLLTHADDDIESENVSEAGDIGDRALHSRRNSLSGSLRLDNNLPENGSVFPIGEDTFRQELRSHDPESLNAASTTSRLPEENQSPLPTDALFQKPDEIQDDQKPLPLWMEYASSLIHLAVFGILGVLTRYLLQKLFGPRIAYLTSDGTVLYLDLPSNMVGSFLMGWFGVVFKGDISRFSDYLAIGLSTGYLGSLTTFSGWNQKMLDLSIDGKWHLSFLGFMLGLFLSAYSIIFGVETAKGFRWLTRRPKTESGDNSKTRNRWRVDTYKRHLASILMMLLLLGLLWAVSGTLLKEEYDDGGSEPQLWLACIVGPLGVWIRWFLARLNGRGLGKAGSLKWVPFGTLIANVSACCVMAALATTKKAVNSKNCDTITTGIQFGLMGCLSTVSTFMAEFNAMRESNHPWRAYAYAISTMVISFVLGILIYDVPVWAKGYK
ncbi:hypothetical protein CDL15_Pgr006496 [Punica granatum]|uniref:Fluoride export protein 2 n=2 Tax=Punica granatum TaxID=22663 RepID=A0A218XYH6_PUNGR|nr:hypothetical protein CDL15_Pgr006496 [Punica granatum]